MKRLVYLLFVSIAFNGFGLLDARNLNQKATRRFLYKTQLDTSRNRYGTHIEVRTHLPATKHLIVTSVDDKQLIYASKYSKTEIILILGEYLTFYGDTCLSNKTYQFRNGFFMERPDSLARFTIEVEALYSFTRMLIVGNPPIRPVLVDRITGEQINANAKKMLEVNEIYKKWYEERKKTDFHNITLPLTGTRYCWVGEDKGISPSLIKLF